MEKIIQGCNLQLMKEVKKKKIPDLYLTPVLSGPSVSIIYKDGKIVKPDLSEAQLTTLKKSGVKGTIYDDSGTLGGCKIKLCRVTGHVVKKKDGTSVFIAEDLQTKSDNPFTIHKRLALLHRLGFKTILPLTSWIITFKASLSEMEGKLQDRLEATKQVVNGKRTNFLESNLYDTGVYMFEPRFVVSLKLHIPKAVVPAVVVKSGKVLKF